ncbi:MAG: hypothetical protein RSG55_02065, partial [Oscillospiraceae bacterium]
GKLSDAEIAMMTPAFAAKKAELDAAKAKLDAGKKQLDEMEPLVPFLSYPFEKVAGLVAEYEAGQQKVAAAEPALKAGKAKLDASLPVLNAGKAKLAASLPALEAGRAKLATGAQTLAAGKAKLAAAPAQLAEGKANLEAAAKQLEDGKALLAEFEAGQAQVDAGYAEVEKNADVKAKIDAGMDPIAAGREVVDEQTVKTTKELTTRLYLYLALLFVAIIGLIASICGISAAGTPGIGKIKAGIILGVVTLLVAVVANVFGMMNAYQDFPLQMVAMLAEAVFSLLFVIGFITYKNALVALMTAE